MLHRYILIALFSLCYISSQSQTIAYTEPDKNDTRNLDFEIVGKLDNHYLIFKNNRSSYTVSVYDDDMKQVSSVKLDFLPTRTISTDVWAYHNFFYIFYQYQKRNVVYCMAAKLNGDGKLMEDVKELDTTVINMFMNNKVYSLLYSEDKQKIALVKINTKNPDFNQVTEVLLDNNLNLLKKAVMNIDTPERNNYLTEFNIDNEGDLVFLRANGTSQKGKNISAITLITKSNTEDKPQLHDVLSGQTYLDDIRLKIDNANRNYLLASFYSHNKRGNVDGLYASIFSKVADSVVSTTYTNFSEQLRQEAKSEGNAKFAFNDFFLQNIVMRRDGGYVIAAESVYSTSRGNQYNRWDYFNSYGSGMLGSPYYYSPFNSYGMYGYYPWYRSGFGYQNTRYFADNIAILSFDSTAKLSWSSVIHKTQYDDNTDDFIGYITMNTGNEVHFLYNQTERKNVLLSDQTVTPDGKVEQQPTLKNLDRGYEFMPRLGKQVAAKQMIIPCTYRNYICFAKVDFQ